MKKWEYKVTDMFIDVKKMNEVGEDGWELVSMIEMGKSTGIAIRVVCVYKREKLK